MGYNVGLASKIYDDRETMRQEKVRVYEVPDDFFKKATQTILALLEKKTDEGAKSWIQRNFDIHDEMVKNDGAFVNERFLFLLGLVKKHEYKVLDFIVNHIRPRVVSHLNRDWKKIYASLVETDKVYRYNVKTSLKSIKGILSDLSEIYNGVSDFCNVSLSNL